MVRLCARCMSRSEDEMNPKRTDVVEKEVLVEIYVIDHCSNCDYARDVADTIRRDFPKVTVEVIDLQRTTRPIPEPVFATPTYLLNGRLWSLGNPSPQEVQTRLAHELAHAT